MTTGPQIVSEEERKQAFRKDCSRFFRLIILGILCGVITGIVGTIFAKAIEYVTELRLEYSFLLYLLPVAGLLIAWMYAPYQKNKVKGTDLVIDAIHSGEPLPGKIVPLIFSSTVITHMFGGSAGREGAALQLGGGLAHWLGKLIHSDQAEKNMLVLCGMAGCFTALFGTPVTAIVFAMEVAVVGVMYYSAIVPCTISCFTAFLVAQAFHGEITAYAVTGVPSIQLMTALQVLVLAAGCALCAIVFCYGSHAVSKALSKWFPNGYIRVVVGGCLVIAMALIFGRQYCGAGGELIASAIQEGKAVPWDFLIKMIITAITLGAGFKGGEIVPAFCVGATFGCVVGPLLGLDPSFAASIGFVCLFCGVTNCPLASFVLSVEVFSGQGSLYYLLAIAISFMLSGYVSIYHRQATPYSKSMIGGFFRKTL